MSERNSLSSDDTVYSRQTSHVYVIAISLSKRTNERASDRIRTYRTRLRQSRRAVRSWVWER